jgi:hypothetical protein
VELKLQRKVGLAVAGVAIVALIVDRMTGAGHGPASAGASVVASPAPDAAASKAPSKAPAVQQPSLRDRLESAREAEHAAQVNAFVVPASWKPVPEKTAAPPAESPEAKSLLLAKRHRLTGVSMGARQVVVIDGTAFTLGGSQQGITLRSIAADGRSVEIESEGVVATLMLDSDARAGTR